MKKSFKIWISKIVIIGIAITIASSCGKDNLENAQWMEQESGTEENLYSVYFLDENNGWIIGSDQIILKTVNAGEDWIDTSPTTPMLTAYFKSICFTDQNTGYIGCYLASGGMNSKSPYFLKTFNGGTTWDYKTSVVLQSTSYPGISDVFFIDDMNGWMVRGERIYSTSLGISGSFEYILKLSQYLYSIHFINQNVGWVAGNNGFIAKTSDGGESWNDLASTVTNDLISIFFVDALNGWAVGYSDDNGLIIKSTDGGQTWYKTIYPATRSLRDIHFINENIGWACGSKFLDSEEIGVILYSDDGGENWSEQHVSSISKIFKSLSFPTQTIGWAVGYNGMILKLDI